jgi:formylmethanofuran dehydrogenase subunit C
MRVAFEEVFQVNADGSIAPREPVHIGGTTMRPGISFSGGGISVGDVDLSELKGKDLEIERQGGTVVIKGSYGGK